MTDHGSIWLQLPRLAEAESRSEKLWGEDKVTRTPNIGNIAQSTIVMTELFELEINMRLADYTGNGTVNSNIARTRKRVSAT